jgi:T-complex protein 1 subunit gamma
MLLRIDDIVSGMSKRDKGGAPPRGGGNTEVEDHDNVDSERMLAE